MSEPMYSPPPPPAPPMTPAGPGAAAQIQGPAIGLLVAGGLGICGALLGLLGNLFGVGMGSLSSMGGGNAAADQYMRYMSGGIGIVVGICALAMYGFVIWAAMQMKQLRNWNMSVAGSIVAMLPCSCCCIIGLPIGIWSLIVLMKPEVKSAFR
jgi:hypothetical protein